MPTVSVLLYSGYGMQPSEGRFSAMSYSLQVIRDSFDSFPRSTKFRKVKCMGWGTLCRQLGKSELTFPMLVNFPTSLDNVGKPLQTLHVKYQNLGECDVICLPKYHSNQSDWRTCIQNVKHSKYTGHLVKTHLWGRHLLRNSRLWVSARFRMNFGAWNSTSRYLILGPCHSWGG
jgi:hypothetical protein